MLQEVWVPSLISPGRILAGHYSEEAMGSKLAPIMVPRKSIFFPLLWKFFFTVQVSPGFQKFTLSHLAFTRDLPTFGFSLTQRNPKRIFTFKNKGAKWKQCLAFVLRGWEGTMEAGHPAGTVASPFLCWCYFRLHVLFGMIWWLMWGVWEC